jgi:hypothetical protein
MLDQSPGFVGQPRSSEKTREVPARRDVEFNPALMRSVEGRQRNNPLGLYLLNRVDFRPDAVAAGLRAVHGRRGVPPRLVMPMAA